MRIGKDVSIAAAGSGLQGITLNEFLGILWKSRRLVAAIVFVFAVAGLIHALFAQPIYRSDALLQVDPQAAGIGAMADFAELSELLEANTVDMEIEILKSRTVLGHVVDNFDLDIRVRPVYAPVIGAAVARSRFSDIGSDILDRTLGTWFDLNKYARGDEHIDVEMLDVPRAFRGKVFTLVVRKGGAFQLRNSKGRWLADGTVGKLVLDWLPSDEPHALLVSALRARPGTHFELSRVRRLQIVNNLKSSLEVTALGDPERQSADQVGLLEVSLEGSDPAGVTAIINDTLEIYLRQNTARKFAEIERAVQFLRRELPKVKARVERSEAALHDYRQRQGSIDISLETAAVLEKIVIVERELSRIMRARQTLLQRFTPRHARVIALDAEAANVRERQQALKREVERLPGTQREILRLSRAVRVNGQLYNVLLNRMHELRVIRAGTTENVKIIDSAAIPYSPVGPMKSLLIVVYPTLGIALGIGLALLRKGLTTDAVEDPDSIEKQLGLPVYAVVPHSAKQARLSRKNRTGKLPMLSTSDSGDLAIESLRGLRTWLTYFFQEEKNKTLLITGAGPGVGKSFISANLGVVFAGAGKRVLLIDADLRKGHLHRYFGIDSKPGLSDVVTGALRIRQVIHGTETKKLLVMPIGALSSNPSELLLDKKFASILEELALEFDYVIIDSPPVLAVTDAAIIGAMTAGALLVVKADAHPLRELEQSVKTLRRLGANVLGVVFNDLDASSRRYGYARFYGYAYDGYYGRK